MLYMYENFLCCSVLFFWVCVTDNDTPILSPHICTYIFFFWQAIWLKAPKKRPCRIGFVYCFANISSQYIFPSHDGSKYEGQTVCMKCPHSVCCACEVAEQVHYSICVNSVLCKMAIVLYSICGGHVPTIRITMRVLRCSRQPSVGIEIYRLRSTCGWSYFTKKKKTVMIYLWPCEMYFLTGWFYFNVVSCGTRSTQNLPIYLKKYTI